MQLSRKNSQTTIPTTTTPNPQPTRDTNKSTSDPGQPSGRWDEGAPQKSLKASVAVQVPDDRDGPIVSFNDTDSSSDDDAGSTSVADNDGPPDGANVPRPPPPSSTDDVVLRMPSNTDAVDEQQPSVTAAEASPLWTVPEIVRTRPYATVGVLLTVLVITAVLTGVLLSPREDGTPIGAPPKPPVQQFAEMIAKWLCDCGFEVDASTCQSVAQDVAYDVGEIYAEPPVAGEVPDGWISQELWSVCPTESERSTRLPEQSRSGYALANVGNWAQNHRELWATNGGQAVVVQWMTLIAALTLSALLLG